MSFLAALSEGVGEAGSFPGVTKNIDMNAHVLIALIALIAPIAAEPRGDREMGPFRPSTAEAATAARSKCLASGLALALLLAAVPAVAGILPPPTVFTVGNTGSCSHNTIQAAINAAPPAGSTVIRISNNVAHNNQALTIANKNIELSGGYPGCGLDRPDADARTTIRGNGGDSVVIVNAAGTERTVILRNLLVRGGGAHNEITARGGGVRIDGLSTVQVRNSRISDNESWFGGGIAINGSSASLLLDDGTIIGEAGGVAGNRAISGAELPGDGGGISCWNGAEIRIRDARLRINTATGDGGGIYASNCTVLIIPNPDFVAGTNGGNGFVTLFENSAGRHGGGLFVTDGAIVFWGAANDFAGRATGNRAQMRGGAVFIEGGSGMLALRVRFEGNLADDRGGSIAVQDGASSFSLGNHTGHSCVGADCQGIFGTRGISGVNTSLIGGAIYAEAGAQVTLYQTQLSDNWAANGSAVHASGGATNVALDNTLVAQNQLYGVGNDTSTIEASGSANLILRHVTMAQNFRASAQFPFIERAVSSIRASGIDGLVILRNSLLWNDGQQLLRLLGAGTAGSCVLGHENSTVPFAVVADPRYADAAFRLHEDSPAIDRCEALNDTGLRDRFGMMRPVDQPDVANGAGAYDAGAIEMPLFNDLIFADSFEQK